MSFFLHDRAVLAALAATVALALACSALSLFVVARRWAFIGEGISHSGFGGAGVAWLLMVAFPPLVHALWLPYLAIIVFCILTALAIGYLSRGSSISGDTAIGIFMVASLAFGFLAQEIFRQFMRAEAPGFWDILFGRFSGISVSYSLGAIAVSAAVLLTVIALGKEILYYCLDPLGARASGVPATLVHYLLMVLIAMTVVIGIKITGSVLVTALLVLPAATANLASQKLRTVLAISIGVSLLASLGGVGLSLAIKSIHLPAGPAIVLLLFLFFLITYLLTRLRRWVS